MVLDCTVFLKMGPNGYISESGRANWAQGQIPGAGFADLNEDLVDTSSPLRYALPDPRAFADAMQKLGVSNRSRVVLYDDNRSMWAARVWWMLRWIGFDNAAVLDGGLKAWKAVGHPVTTDYVAPAAGSLFVHERPEIIADKSDVLAAIEGGSTCLIDALPPASFNGEVNVYGRPGHIPTATNASAAALASFSSRSFFLYMAHLFLLSFRSLFLCEPRVLLPSSTRTIASTFSSKNHSSKSKVPLLSVSYVAMIFRACATVVDGGSDRSSSSKDNTPARFTSASLNVVSACIDHIDKNSS